ncbi:ABC transporter substrate-binding protein [Photobacterium aphoticum]|nr:ABC transporter substrate-binding protein [Photobacterium aphoticum]GHA52772.1 peptide-binding protein [Photobacterium aphoticum]
MITNNNTSQRQGACRVRLSALCLSLFIALPVGAAPSVSREPMSQEPVYQQPVTIALGDEPTAGFDPIYGWGRYNNPLIQSALLKRTGEGEVAGDLAQHWTLSPDRTTWTVRLQPDLVAGDGTPLTASDVAFTYRTAKSVASLYDLTNLAKVDVQDAETVIFHLKQPDIGFLDTLASLGIVPQNAYGPDYAQHPVGSGPYQFVRWQKGQSLELVANPHYHGEKPHLARLIIVFSDEASRYTQLLSHQIDLAAIPPQYALTLPAAIKQWRITSVDNRGIAWPMLPFDGHDKGNDVTSDKAIRQAIDSTIDRELLVHALLDGYARTAYSIADGLPWSIAPADKGKLSPTGTVNPEAKQAAMQAAKEALTAAGWLVQDDGVRAKNGVRAAFTLYYKSGDSIREQLALTVAQMIKPLGIVVTTQGTSWERISQVMHRSPVLFGFGVLSPSEMRYTYHSQYQGVDFYNSGYYANPIVDRELDAAQSAPSWSQAMIHFRQAQQQIYQDVPWTWLVNLTHVYAGNPCLDLGKPMMEPHAHGWPLTNNITDWTWQCKR